MIKRLLSFVFLLLIVSACVSCDWIYAPEEPYDPNRVISVFEEDGSDCIEYQSKKYVYTNIFYTHNCKGEFFLGKIGIKLRVIGYVGYSCDYYSYTNQNPTYIYSKPSPYFLYLREDYDFRSDYYLISGTDLKIVYSDAVDDISNYSRSNLDYDYSKSVKVTLYPEACPQLELRLDVFCDNGMWYALDKTDTVHKLTQAFVDILIENKIIQN